MYCCIRMSTLTKNIFNFIFQGSKVLLALLHLHTQLMLQWQSIMTHICNIYLTIGNNCESTHQKSLITNVLIKHNNCVGLANSQVEKASCSNNRKKKGF